MIPKKQAAVGRVDGDEVDHQVLRRRGGRCRPEELPPRGDPREDAVLIGCFTRVAWGDRRDELRDKRANIVVWHPVSVMPHGRASTEDSTGRRRGTPAQAVTGSGRETVTWQGLRAPGRGSPSRCSSVGRASAL